jgi:1,4-alpha-glucan branching enzyme
MVTILENGSAEFRFYRPNVSKVFLVGDFNDWRTDQVRMSRQPDGHWVAHLPLGAGDYKFRYIADGLWYTDFAASGVEPGDFGLDSLLRVPPRQIRLETPAENKQVKVADVAATAAA